MKETKEKAERKKISTCLNQPTRLIKRVTKWQRICIYQIEAVYNVVNSRLMPCSSITGVEMFYGIWTELVSVRINVWTKCHAEVLPSITLLLDSNEAKHLTERMTFSCPGILPTVEQHENKIM